MQTQWQAAGRCGTNDAARKRLLSRFAEPLFVADWDRALFIHYEVDPVVLQREVPFQLDLVDGRAYVSLVAFTLRDFRFRFGGALGGWLVKPIANHTFLNVRTYVRHRGESGILFLAEWLSNPMSVLLGPRTFGLPYRFGRIDYQHRHETGMLRGNVAAVGSELELTYEARIEANPEFEICPSGSFDDFLLERYTAFTARGNKRGFFRIWHEPWPQIPVSVVIQKDELLAETFGWFKTANLVGANYSTGARNVWMGWPHRIRTAATERHGRLETFFELP